MMRYILTGITSHLDILKNNLTEYHKKRAAWIKESRVTESLGDEFDQEALGMRLKINIAALKKETTNHNNNILYLVIFGNFDHLLDILNIHFVIKFLEIYQYQLLLN